MFDWLTIEFLENASIYVAIIAAGVGLYLAMRYLGRTSHELNMMQSRIEMDVDAFKAMAGKLAYELENILSPVIEGVVEEKLLAVKLPEKQVVNMDVFRGKIEKVESDLQNLRKLLFENPDAAVTIPLIMKDIKYLRQDDENLRKEIDRIVGFNKWFIGIMVTIFIGILGLAISVLLRG